MLANGCTGKVPWGRRRGEEGGGEGPTGKDGRGGSEGGGAVERRSETGSKRRPPPLPRQEEEEELDVQTHHLRDALAANAVRVIDLFREWDQDGDGVVDREEFRRALELTGFSAPKEQESYRNLPLNPRQ